MPAHAVPIDVKEKGVMWLQPPYSSGLFIIRVKYWHSADKRRHDGSFCTLCTLCMLCPYCLRLFTSTNSHSQFLQPSRASVASSSGMAVFSLDFSAVAR